MIGVSIIVGFISVVTMIGNLLVIIAFKIDKQLQTISNCFLLSLAVADFTIGLVSMPLYTLYLLMGYWPLGPFLCDLWLSLDYTMSTASAANLLVICFDRYYSVTRPLTYRARRTPKKVGIMIGCIWTVSVVLWTPWIFAWPYIEGVRTVPEKECYIQFLTSNAILTIITAVIAFYIPISIMTILYFKIYKETEKRQKRIPMLQASSKYRNSKRSKLPNASDVRRSTFSANGDISLDLGFDYSDFERDQSRSRYILLCCSKLLDRDFEQTEDDSTSDYTTSPNVASIRTCINQTTTALTSDSPIINRVQINNTSDASFPRSSDSNHSVSVENKEELGTNNDPSIKPLLNDDITYTILINLPDEMNGENLQKPSIRMLYDDSQISEATHQDNHEQCGDVENEIVMLFSNQGTSQYTNEEIQPHSNEVQELQSPFGRLSSSQMRDPGARPAH
ncbi:hypothetical protein DPMN_094913 [Dreissena polymorpha]|uniref:G-protein coupled receptors family 1 profile domain-containing protein n=1 Tax=Dreissena polymorpha TaxID=45954 RepID=A0A9D4R288_DREPO|nr:hypothetical protein DPMN_094913 [Dreissena polymorpha]